MTKKARSTKKPERIVVGPVRAAVIASRGDKGGWYWRAVRYEDGKEHTVWTGRGSREEVERALASLVGRGEHIRRQRPQAGDITTVRDLLECWITDVAERGEHAPLSVRTFRNHARALLRHLGEQAVSTLNTDVLRDYVRRSRQPFRGTYRYPGGPRERVFPPRSPHSIKMDLSVLAQAWRWARSIEALPNRDLILPKLKAGNLRKKVTPEADQVAAVVEWIGGWRGEVLTVQWGTGARIGEILAARVRDFDAPAATLHVAGKTGERTLPLHAELVRSLSERVAGLDGDARLWPINGVQAATTSINWFLRRACADLQIEPWSTHALRRSAVNRLLDNGVAADVAAALMGHTVNTMHASYRQVREAQIRDAATGALSALPSSPVLRLRNPHK